MHAYKAAEPATSDDNLTRICALFAAAGDDALAPVPACVPPCRPRCLPTNVCLPVCRRRLTPAPGRGMVRSTRCLRCSARTREPSPWWRSTEKSSNQVRTARAVLRMVLLPLLRRLTPNVSFVPPVRRYYRCREGVSPTAVCVCVCVSAVVSFAWLGGTRGAHPTPSSGAGYFDISARRSVGVDQDRGHRKNACQKYFET